MLRRVVESDRYGLPLDLCACQTGLRGIERSEVEAISSINHVNPVGEAVIFGSDLRCLIPNRQERDINSVSLPIFELRNVPRRLDCLLVATVTH